MPKYDCLQGKEAGLMHQLAVFRPSIRHPGLCSFNPDHEKVEDMERRWHHNTAERQRLANPVIFSMAQDETGTNGNPAARSRLVQSVLQVRKEG